MSNTMELTVAPQGSTALTLTDAFSGEVILVESVFRPGGAASILDGIRSHVRAQERDISTEKGRKAVKALDLKVRKSRVALDDAGKELKDEYRKKGDAIDAERRTIRADLDALSVEVMADLVAFEEAQAARIKAHEDALAAIPEDDLYGMEETSAELQKRLDFLRAYPARDWQEFDGRARKALDAEIGRTVGLLAGAQAAEAAAAEAVRVAEEAAAAEVDRLAQEQADREARIAAQAAETARLAAEAAAEPARGEAAQQAADRLREAEERAAEEAAQVERDRQAEEDRAAEALAEAQRQTQQAADREAAQQRRAEAAEQQGRMAQAQAERDAAAAVERERQRVANAEAAAKAEADRRERDRAHKGAIHREMVADLTERASLTEDVARAVVTALAMRQVRHVSVVY